MIRFLTGLLVALAVCLAGCGGGGGSTNAVTPDASAERMLTGKIISSTAGAPVSNALVNLGGFTAVSAADGTFEIGPILPSIEIPSTFSVDVSGAGAGFYKSMVLYNGQVYDYNVIDTPVGIRNADTNALGTITAYDTSVMPSVPFTNKDTIIAGHLVRYDDPTVGIPGVTITFGHSSVFTAVTGRKGYFAINIGRDESASFLFDATHKTFSMNVPASAIITDAGVSYSGQSQTYSTDSILLPDTILEDASTDLQTIVYGVYDGPPTPGF